ncbi:MAG: hypothetical protein PHO02_04800 [Candidatus Nanoarchaeia archaeon]|nr:hypothetical protein [Candidatus Nanoarchaeia archaeon]
METIISVIGITLAAIISVIYYIKKKKAFLAILWLVILSIGLGTPLLYFVMPPVIAVAANRWLYQKLKRNWLAFLLSLPGILPVAGLLVWAIPYYIPVNSDTIGLGALVAGLGMIIIYVYLIIASIILYFLSTFIYLIVRWVRKHGH